MKDNQKTLKVLVATKELQGVRKNDFSFTDEGELVKFASACDGEEIDGGCGCRRAFAGVDSLKASTTAKVVEIELTPETFKQRLHESEIKAGWMDPIGTLDKEAQEYLDNISKELLDLASHFPVGMILEKRGDTIQERYPDPVKNNR